MRRQPDVESPNLCAAIRVLVLDDVAGDRPDTALASGRVVAARSAAAGRIFVIDPNDLLAHDGHCVVHQRDVFGDFEARPRPAGCERLANGIVGTTARISNGLECGAAHGFGGRVDHPPDVLGSNLERQYCRGYEEYE